MNQEEVNGLDQKAVQEKWTYPQLFNALAELGVERYEVDVLRQEIKYVGGGTSFVKLAGKNFQQTELGGKFDEAAIKAAIGRTQRGEINYQQFLAEIAAAGVPFYRVDMKPRRITYHSAGPDKYVESVPQP